MSKIFCAGEDFRKKMAEAALVLSDFVGATLGPRGRNVLLHKAGESPFITKDGVTVAEYLDLEDPVKNAVSKIIKQAAAQTNHDAGDGTTTSTVLATSFLIEGLEALEEEHSPIEIKKGIEKAVKSLVQILEEDSIPIRSAEDVKHIATISASGDTQIGSMVSLAVDKVGKNGSITVEESRSFDTVLDLSEGFKFNSGYVATAFVTDERRAVIRYDNPVFLVTDAKISTVESILPALEVAARENRPFVIVADEIEGQALAALIMNAVRGTMKVCAIKAPSYGEERKGILSDLAIATGAKFVTTREGDSLEKVSLVDFGSAKTVEVSRSSTIIVGASGSITEVSDRINLLKNLAKEADSEQQAKRVQDRITRLSSGVAVIRVGGSTQVEVTEKKHRVEDALEAVRSAQEEGVLSGGSVSLLKAVAQVSLAPPEFENTEQKVGFEIALRACCVPFKRMAKNCGITTSCGIPGLVLEVSTDSDGLGYDFRTGEKVNMYERGIIEPAKVTRCSLQNAASVAAALLTANHIIVDDTRVAD